LTAVVASASCRSREAAGDPDADPTPRPTAPEDPRDQAATMPDPRGRSLYPEASCLAPRPAADAGAGAGSAPRCVISFGQVVTALGVGRAGTLAITSLAHAATVGWTLPAATAGILFEPLPADAEARAILVDEGRREALFAVASEIWRYDTTSGRLQGRIPGPGGMIEDIAWSADGETVAVVAAGERHAHLVRRDGAALRPLPTESAPVRVAIDASGARAAVAGESGEVALFDLRAAAPPNVATPSTQPASGVAFASRDRLVVAGTDGTIRVLDARTGRESARVDVGSAALALAVSPDGSMAAASFGDGALRLYSLPDLGSVATFSWHRARISALGFGTLGASGGQILLSADNDGELAVWEVH
jgi:hypothetical protein